MVEVKVARLGLDSASKTYVVILQEKDGDRLLPIWIGQAEAESIVMQMNGIKRERPLTHDLCKSLIVGLGGTLRRVQITKVQKSTYYAELHVNRDDQVVQIDARPSDSIAIALRLGAPIFVQESLLTMIETEEEGVDLGPGAGGPSAEPPSAADELSAEQLKEHLEKLRPEDFGKFSP
jgi:bifunctional DNase/RNase